MVNIDTVYQRVLVLANKEQRGYITPQEFNLFANQAQMDIFEQYFYDLNQFLRIPGNDTMHSDMVELLKEKINIFEKEDVIEGFVQPSIYEFGGDETVFNIEANLNDFYRLENVRVYRNGNWRNVEKVSKKELRVMNAAPLTKPTSNRPLYTMDGVNNIINFYNDADTIAVDYIKKPIKVEWNGGLQGLYNSTNSVDFELHSSEEVNLVIKILGLAGITLKDPGLYQIAGAEDNKNIQQEKQ